MLSRFACTSAASARVGLRCFSKAAGADMGFGFQLSEESRSYVELARKFAKVCVACCCWAETRQEKKWGRQKQTVAFASPLTLLRPLTT